MAATSMPLPGATVAPAPERASPSVVRRQRKPAPATLRPGHRVGAWRVERELGRGGMAAVYAVTHTRFGKRAALKLCHRTALSSEFTAATFLREARVVHLVDHPAATDVFATGTFDGRPYLVMERLAGESLGELYDRGALSRHDSLAILRELCDVLEAAHAAGVVHRDLKLDNVVVLAAPAAATGRRIKLVDWGVAAILDELDPMHGMIAGTLTYVAPEQVRAIQVTPAADIYSLGVLAYQLLLGQPPFSSRSDLELIQLHLRAAPPPPATLWPDIPDELADLLLAMLAKDPAQRPTIAEIRRVLANARATQMPAVRWLPSQPPLDVLGRPAPIAFARYRLLGAVIGIALTAASAMSLL